MTNIFRKLQHIIPIISQAYDHVFSICTFYLHIFFPGSHSLDSQNFELHNKVIPVVRTLKATRNIIIKIHITLFSSPLSRGSNKQNLHIDLLDFHNISTIENEKYFKVCGVSVFDFATYTFLIIDSLEYRKECF